MSQVTIIVTMSKRIIILRFVMLILRPVLASLKKEAETTDNQLDDALVQLAEDSIKIFESGALDDAIDKA